MKQLIPDNINKMLDDIVTKFFEGNRIADRGMSILGVKFAMNKTEKQLHAKLAHLFPALADKVSEHQASRDNLTVYGLTPLDDTDYASPLDFFNRILDYMIDLERLIEETADAAKEDDFYTYTFLLAFTKDIVNVTNQCLLLVDKAENYNGDWQAFDHCIEDWIIL